MSFLEEVIALKLEKSDTSLTRYYDQAKGQIRIQIEQDPSKTIWSIEFDKYITFDKVEAVKKMFERDGFFVVVDDFGPEDMLVFLPLQK